MKHLSPFARIVAVMILLVGSLALMKAAHAVLASSETNGWYSYGLQAVHPVEVTLVGLERESAYQALVSRVSPRGNTEPMNHRFSGGGNTWFLQNDYLSTVRVHLPPAYVGKLDFVRIEVGTRSHGVEGPHGAGEWQPLSTPDERGRTVYEYVVPPDQLPFTVVPVFKSVLNYVGDIHLALWTLLWAALAVVPPFLVHLLQRARPHVAQALKDWFICGSVLFMLIVTAAQFFDPPSGRAAAVFPAREIAIALSLAIGGVIVSSGGRDTSPLKWHGEPRQWRARWIVPLLLGAGLLLRVVDLDSLMQVDTYNISAALALVDTGTFEYLRNLDITHAVALLVGSLGRSLAVARIPFVLASTLTILVTYLLGSFVSRRVGVVAALLFAMSPHHIAVSNYVREYPVNLLVGQSLLLLQFWLYRRYGGRKLLFYPVYLVATVSAFALVFGYSEVANNGTIPAVLQVNALCAAALVLHHINRHYRTLFPFAVTVAGAVFIGAFFVVHSLGPFARGATLETGFLHVYFDPYIVRPMQWFSLSAISLLLLGALVSLPYASRTRSPYFDAVLLGFWGTLVLFTFKFTAGDTPRYIYHTAGLFSILFAGGLIWLWNRLNGAVNRRWLRLVATGGLFLLLVNPINTMQAALFLTPNVEDRRRPASLASGDYFYEVADMMRDHGADRATPILQEYAGRPFHSSWVFERPFTRYWEAWNRIPHETGEDVYFLARRGLSEDQSREAFETHPTGLFLTSEYQLYPPRDFVTGDVRFEYLRSMRHPWYAEEGFVLYRWHVDGDSLPSLSSVPYSAVFRR